MNGLAKEIFMVQKHTSFALAGVLLLATGVVVTDEGAERRSSESEYGSELRLLFRPSESVLICSAESAEFNFFLDFGDVGLLERKPQIFRYFRKKCKCRTWRLIRKSCSLFDKCVAIKDTWESKIAMKSAHNGI